MNLETCDFGIFLPVRREEGRDRDVLRQRFRLAFLHDREDDVVTNEQAVPGSVLGEKIRHARHDVDGNVLRAGRLVAEHHQAGVMADMGVGEKNAIEADRSFDRRGLVEALQLLLEVGRRLEQPAFRSSAAPVDQRQRGREPAQGWILPRRVPGICDLRFARVLRDAEDEERDGAA